MRQVTLRRPSLRLVSDNAAPRSVRAASQIDPSFPVYRDPTTASVRANFDAAKREIEDLQDDKLDLAGGTMSGPLTLSGPPTFDLHAATKAYVDTISSFPEAPPTGLLYLRRGAPPGWVVLDEIDGGVIL